MSLKSVMERGLSEARSLGNAFPELDWRDHSKLAIRYQTEFLSILRTQFKPAAVARYPEIALVACALMTRKKLGRPTRRRRRL